MESNRSMASDLYIGLMTGTSLDGVDGVLADLAGPEPQIVGSVRLSLAQGLRKELLLLSTSGWDELHRSAVASQHLARCYAGAVQQLLLDAGIEPDRVRAVGVHGQTVRHRPDAGYTIQLNAPATLAELTGIDVVADFRSRDIAAGGQGAPLLPVFHAGIFTTDSPRTVVNIGGIANVTGLPAAGSGEPVIGFDCGPGNVLIDGWAAEHLGKEKELGSIEVGKYADMAVLDRNYLQVRQDGLNEINVLVTILGGKVVYTEPDYANRKGLPQVGYRGNLGSVLIRGRLTDRLWAAPHQ